MTPIDEIKKLGTIMGIWAHPDDETYCAGGLISQATQNGQQVICITATKGELGIQDRKKWPAEQLAEIRTQELQAAYKILGVDQFECLDIGDGDCKNAVDGLDMIYAAILAYKPDTIITFGQDGLTGHDDHKAVSKWTTEAGKAKNIPVYLFVMPEEAYILYQDACEEAAEHGGLVDDMFFNIDRPKLGKPTNCDLYMKLDESLWQKKLAALQAMPSQTEKFIKQLGPNYYRYIFQYEAFIRVNS